MGIDEFIATVHDAEPPANLSFALLALWWNGHGDWELRTSARKPTKPTRPLLGFMHICTEMKAISAIRPNGTAAPGRLWRPANLTTSGFQSPHHFWPDRRWSRPIGSYAPPFQSFRLALRNPESGQAVNASRSAVHRPHHGSRSLSGSDRHWDVPERQLSGPPAESLPPRITYLAATKSQLYWLKKGNLGWG